MDNNLFDVEYNKLNIEQKKAVDQIYGQVMVVAWPGTGKTQIIWLRTANIILKWWINPENILIATFTEAWVVAIKERLLKFIWNDAYKVWVSTIHSFSQEVIKTFPEKFIEYKASNAIDDIDSLEILKDLIDILVKKWDIIELTNETDQYLYLRDIKSRISTLKQEWINEEKFNEIILDQESQYAEELSEIKPTLKKYTQTEEKQKKHIAKLHELNLLLSEYKKYLRENSLYDFNDMINFVLEKLKTDEELKYYYAEKFQFIMLDEFQDSNNAQNDIFDFILSVTEEPNIMVVWDDDQSIYRFAWANIENMLDFSNKYPDTNFVVLENNYRSTQSILDSSQDLIANNWERLSNKISSINKKLISSWDCKNIKSKPNIYKALNDIDEENFILEEVKNQIASWIDLDDIAIIVRGNKEVEKWTQLLLQNNIEAESKLKSNILNSDYVIFIIKLLEIINNPSNSSTYTWMVDIFRSDIFWFNKIDVYKINKYLYMQNYSSKYPLSLLDILDEKDELEELWLTDLKTIIEFRSLIFTLQDIAANSTFLIFFHELLKRIDILNFIDSNWSFDDKEDIFTLFNMIKNWNLADRGLSIDKLLNKINLYKTYNYPINRQIIRKRNIWIQVMTAHSSKWLEYETVFIPWLYSSNWDSKRIADKLKLPLSIAWDWLQELKEKNLEETRRLFFVAITRAKKNLFLSYPAWTWTKPLLVSQFINELESNLVEYPSLEMNLESINPLIDNKLENNLISYNEIEFDYIKEFFKNYKISPSDLNIFMEDPKEFLNRVVFKYPFIDNTATIFGKVYHKVLELFYLKLKKENKIPNKDYLTKTFYALISKEILKPEDLDLLKEKWIKSLEWYFDNYVNTFKESLFLESSFRHKNIIFNNIPLTWTIDKIELNSNNDISGDNLWQWSFIREWISLVDYKTWKTKTVWNIKWLDRYWNKKQWEWKYFRQLLFYKLLCELDNDISSKFEVESLVIDFVEWKDWKYSKLEINFTDEEYEEFKQELIDSRTNIVNIDFWKDLLNK